MSKKVLITVTAVVILLLGYLLAQEFRRGAQNENGQEESTVSGELSRPEFVAEAEETQITKELVEQSKRGVVSKDYIVKCAPCHNRDGSGPVGAPIQGMSKEALVQKLQAYKRGEERNDLMHGLMEKMTDEEIMKLADEISKF